MRDYRQEDEIEKKKRLKFYRDGSNRAHHAAREDDVQDGTEERYALPGFGLHIFRDSVAGEIAGNEWVVWLNTEGGDFDGLVIGLGDSRNGAVQDAVTILESLTAKLQETPHPRIG